MSNTPKTRPKTIAILGIPIDNLTVHEAVVKTVEEMKRSLPHPQYIGTVNVDFIVNTVGWTPSATRHPELLLSLRNAVFNTADGMPVVWLSRLLGCPLKERVAGADFIPQLIAQCQQQGKSVFLLGGDSKAAEAASEKLKMLYPSLSIVGTASPHVAVSGEELEYAAEEDTSIINSINASRADLLLIFFGNPKQEIWFQRIRNQLIIPLAIGGGGTLNFIAGNLKRAPQWMQKYGLEWFYRLLLEPARLAKRYLYDLAKFSIIALPLLGYHFYRKALYYAFHSRSKKESELIFPSAGQEIDILALPTKLDKNIGKREIKAPLVILDFRQVEFVDAAALGWLLQLSKTKNLEDGQLYFVGVPNPIRRLMRVHRVWDQFQAHTHETFADLVVHLRKREGRSFFCEAVELQRTCMLIHFLGELDASHDHHKHFVKLSNAMENRHAIIDLRYCTFIDSSGIGFLLKLRRHVMASHHQMLLCSVNPVILQILKVSQVDHLFHFYPTEHAALSAIQ